MAPAPVHQSASATVASAADSRYPGGLGGVDPNGERDHGAHLVRAVVPGVQDAVHDHDVARPQQALRVSSEPEPNFPLDHDVQRLGGVQPASPESV